MAIKVVSDCACLGVVLLKVWLGVSKDKNDNFGIVWVLNLFLWSDMLI